MLKCNKKAVCVCILLQNFNSQVNSMMRKILIIFCLFISLTLNKPSRSVQEQEVSIKRGQAIKLELKINGTDGTSIKSCTVQYESMQHNIKLLTCQLVNQFYSSRAPFQKSSNQRFTLDRDLLKKDRRVRCRIQCKVSFEQCVLALGVNVIVTCPDDQFYIQGWGPA